MMKQRRSVKHIATFKERLGQEALEYKEAAEKQANGSQAREPLRRARQAESASNIDKSLSSLGLGPPEALKSLFAK